MNRPKVVIEPSVPKVVIEDAMNRPKVVIEPTKQCLPRYRSKMLVLRNTDRSYESCLVLVVIVMSGRIVSVG